MSESIQYVRAQQAPSLPPPASNRGIRAWLWQNLFASMTNFSTVSAAIGSILMIVLTVGFLWFGVSTILSLVNFAFINAVWSDPENQRRLVCATSAQGGLAPDNVGACWPFVSAKMKLFIYGRYPGELLWRPNLVFLILAIGLIWLIIEKAPFKRYVGGFMILVFPLIALILLTGGHTHISSSFIFVWLLSAIVLIGAGILGSMGKGGEGLQAFSGFLIAAGAIAAYIALCAFALSLNFGMQHVETANWGGLLVTLVVALTGIVVSLPLGILLALGRRSDLPVIRTLSIIFIEFWRGVPLITVLFMSSVMLPLFLPKGVEFDKLLRALIGVALFSAAYMAEVVRGGLQAIPKGQFEGAASLGLSYSQSMRFIVLPQALKIVIPGIVNTFIGLFKDTTLVLIIGLFDLLGSVQSSFTDPSWSTPVTSVSGYLFAAFLFWVFCFAMSRYSMYLERKLHTGHKR